MCVSARCRGRSATRMTSTAVDESVAVTVKKVVTPHDAHSKFVYRMTKCGIRPVASPEIGDRWRKITWSQAVALTTISWGSKSRRPCCAFSSNRRKMAPVIRSEGSKSMSDEHGSVRRRSRKKMLTWQACSARKTSSNEFSNMLSPGEIAKESRRS